MPICDLPFLFGGACRHLLVVFGFLALIREAKVGVEFVFDEWRQARALRFYFSGKALIVLTHQPVKRGLIGTAALVLRLLRRGNRRFAQAGCAHGWVGELY